MIKGKQVYLLSWLATATVLLSLVGLTAETSQPQTTIISQLPS